MPSRTLLQALRENAKLLAAIAIAFAAYGLFVGILYVRSGQAMEESIRSRLRSAAAAAAMQFDARSLAGIHGRKDMQSPAFRDAVERLRLLREALPDIRYAYILRKTGHPMTLEFVADADALSSDAQLDRNGNGVIDEEEEPSFPGDTYDVTDVPVLQQEAFERAAVDAEFTVDQWGTLISAYAPIRIGGDGEVVGVLGIDMRASDYLASTRSVFSPFAFATVFMGGIVVAACLMLLIYFKRVQSLERLNAERSGLLQLTFHQMGEPLTIFQWSAEMLRECSTDAERMEALPEHMQYLEDGIRRMSGIIDALCEAERVESGTIDYRPRTVHAEDLLYESLRGVADEIAARKQTLHVRAELGVDLRADPARIADVLQKLVRNASDFSPAGGVIAVRCARRYGAAVISVEDRGEGIDPQDLSRISEKYVRGAKAHLKRPDGKGLSLYTARGIVAKAGGRLWIRSKPGRGTTVSFTLPLA